ncbi:MAG: hypothetical protein PVJ76_10965 [Gemmatimonadota bacterium]|jgi:hypothetical protein
MRHLLALITLILLLPALAAAQGPIQLFPGDRVRLTAPDCQLQKQPAAFVSLENDILTASVGEDQVQCPFEALTRLEISLGDRVWHRDAVRGMKYGALLGLAAGVALLAGADPEEETPAGQAFLAVVGLGGTGFLVGAGINALRDSEEWLEAPLPIPGPSVLPSTRGRFQVGLSIPLLFRN